MNIAIIGCGGIAHTHVRALRRLGLRPVLAVGHSREQAAAFAAGYGIPNAADNLHAALDAGIDCVHLCTPPTLHAGEARAVLGAGRHLISEKPLCLAAEEGYALAAMAKKRDLVAATCLNVRYYAAMQHLRAAVETGDMGDVLHVQGSYLQQFNLPPHADSWRFDPMRAGDLRAVTEIGTHWFDLARFLSGQEITSVLADFQNAFPVRYRHGERLTLEQAGGEPVPTDTEDAAAVLLRFENGAVGSVFLSEIAAGHGNALSIELSGTKAAYRFSEDAPETLWRGGAGRGGEEIPFLPVQREETFAALFEAVYRAIATGAREGYPTMADGAAVAAVCEAAKKSARTGRWTAVEGRA